MYSWTSFEGTVLETAIDTSLYDVVNLIGEE
jgi:hypothetical protein